jgi:hypothetical protein
MSDVTPSWSYQLHSAPAEPGGTKITRFRREKTSTDLYVDQHLLVGEDCAGWNFRALVTEQPRAAIARGTTADAFSVALLTSRAPHR